MGHCVREREREASVEFTHCNTRSMRIRVASLDAYVARTQTSVRVAEEDAYVCSLQHYKTHAKCGHGQRSGLVTGGQITPMRNCNYPSVLSPPRLLCPRPSNPSDNTVLGSDNTAFIPDNTAPVPDATAFVPSFLTTPL